MTKASATVVRPGLENELMSSLNKLALTTTGKHPSRPIQPRSPAGMVGGNVEESDQQAFNPELQPSRLPVRRTSRSPIVSGSSGYSAVEEVIIESEIS